MNNKIFKYLLFVFLYLFSYKLFAGSEEILAPSGLFDPPPEDKSIQYLGTIFNIGSVGDDSSHHEWFKILFDRFNWLILTAAVFVVSYVGVVSTINTAQEGEVMGKKWSSIWIPLRTALGLLLITPTQDSGYSLIQSTVMWIVVSGVGMADSVWDVVTDNFHTGTGPTQIDNIMQLEDTAVKLTGDLMKSAVCMEAINRYLPQGKTAEFYQSPYTSDTVYNDGNSSRRFAQWNIGVRDDNQFQYVCGNYNIEAYVDKQKYSAVTEIPREDITPENLNFLTNKIYDRKVYAIEAMLRDLREFASLLLDEEVYPRDPKYPSYDGNGRLLRNSNSYSPDRTVKAVSDIYIKEMSKLATVQGTSVIGFDPESEDKNFNYKDNRNPATEAIIKNAKARGWVSAGEYYYVLNRSKTAILWPTCSKIVSSSKIPVFKFSDKESSPGPNKPRNIAEFENLVQQQDSDPKEGTDYKNPPKQDAFINKLGDLKPLFLNNGDIENLGRTAFALSDADVYFFKDQNDMEELLALNDETRKYAAGVLLPLQKLLEKIDPVKIIQNKMNRPNQDVILSITKYGDELMTGAEIMLFMMIPIFIGIALAAGFVISIPFTGPIYQASPIITGIVIPVYFMILGIALMFWTVGASFAVYVPMIPYIIYISGVMGWFISVVEAVIAAPMLAVGLVIPSQDEIGKVAPGLAILANIFMRPMLMVIGFTISALLIRAVLGLVNESIGSTFESMRKESTAVLIPVIQLFVYAMLVISIVSQGFELVHILPDKILRWIGGATESAGKSIADANTKAAEGATDKAAGGMKDAAAGAAESEGVQSAANKGSGMAMAGGAKGGAAVGNKSGMTSKEDRAQGKQAYKDKQQAKARQKHLASKGLAPKK